MVNFFFYVTKAYELRMIDDDSDEIMKRTTQMPALADKLNITKANYDTLIFLEKNLSNIETDGLNSNILGSSTKDSETVK